MTEQRADFATRFQPGNPGSGRAKHKGQRDRISAAFLKAYADEFEAKGVSVLQRLAEEDPATFAKIGVALLPKEHEHRHVLEGVDDAKIAAMIEELEGAIAARAARVMQ